ncbi:TlpA family protein disulfide reductase [Capnocytophaga felis]|nr:TlpA disulfide reductase family protein [Capnocytophaga felis]
MKKLFIVTLATLSFVACEKKNEYITVSGQIKNHNGTNFQLIGRDIERDLKINPDGSFSDTLTKAGYYTISGQSGHYVPVYLPQGGEINIVIDDQNPLETKFLGKDTIASVYLREKSKLTKELQNTFNDLFEKNVSNFKSSLNEINKKYGEFLKNYKGLPEDFITLEERANKFIDLHLKVIYPQFHYSLTGTEIKLPAEFEAEIAKIDYDNADDFSMFDEYKRLIDENFFSKFDFTNPDWNSVIGYIRSLKSENIKSHLSQFLVQGMSAGNSFETNQILFDAIKELSKNKELVTLAETDFLNFKKLRPEAPSPSFNFENFAGGKTSLESLKGKLVYIDVWATWCVPCLNEFPALQALEKEYHGKDIVFVSISVDKDKQKWIDYQKAKKLDGIQLHADFEAEVTFSKAYTIKTIPRFILIDKNGNIINADAPRPSEPEIKKLIDDNL